MLNCSMRPIEVVPYNPAWPEMFNREAELIRQLLGEELISLHHIGSTSIPGTAAKPIIDILAEVRDINAIDARNEVLGREGYTARGEYGIPGRRYFFKGNGEVHTCHLHVFGSGNPELKRHIVFRNYMRSHPEAAKEYASLKSKLARLYPNDIDAYCDGKDAFIKEIDRRAIEWQLEIL